MATEIYGHLNDGENGSKIYNEGDLLPYEKPLPPEHELRAWFI